MVWFFPTDRVDALAFPESVAPVSTAPGKDLHSQVNDTPTVGRSPSSGALPA